MAQLLYPTVTYTAGIKFIKSCLRLTVSIKSTNTVPVESSLNVLGTLIPHKRLANILNILLQSCLFAKKIPKCLFELGGIQI